ncbi:PREDICTED: transmembrane protein 208-like isoform X3 [Nicotiana attenuata]|uniref:transmembrane protein 208-like isoform X3 n=1 Tax=Nicotiana attenuata TaxID=49451 RepID=UPI000905177C|nr:PREDICTED: transmembrane protein 208-like isoform X3 [Nicotiana attenuata]
MANQGAKKRKEENARHMKKLFQIILACNVIYLLVRAGIFYSSFTWKHIIGLLLTSLAYALPYKQLDSMSKPSYGDDGELFDGGYDMSTGGICGYLHDVIYITCFVQLASIISDKFWYTYLVIRRNRRCFSFRVFLLSRESLTQSRKIPDTCVCSVQTLWIYQRIFTSRFRGC